MVMILDNPVQEKLELQCNWPLTAESKVVIAGAYTGRVAEVYSQRYGCYLYLYEPQLWACDVLRDKFNSPKIRIFDYALGVDTMPGTLREYGTDGCSLIEVNPDSPRLGQCSLIEVSRAFKNADLKQIDLFVCNMEGYEHKLIPYMVDKGMIKNIRFILCQIHGGDREALNQVMNQTHTGGEWIPGGWALWERK